MKVKIFIDILTTDGAVKTYKSRISGWELRVYTRNYFLKTEYSVIPIDFFAACPGRLSGIYFMYNTRIIFRKNRKRNIQQLSKYIFRENWKADSQNF